LSERCLALALFSHIATILTDSVGSAQKGDIVKELMQTAYDNGINMFDVSFESKWEWVKY
jgi:hypothetical protein